MDRRRSQTALDTAGKLIVSYLVGPRDADTGLGFHYRIQADDLDTDGISIAANALKLNGATIQDSGGNPAELGLGEHKVDGSIDDGEHKVDGSIDHSPVVRRVWIESSPGSGDTYTRGETIRIALQFSEPVAVIGVPQLELTIGATARFVPRGNTWTRSAMDLAGLLIRTERATEAESLLIDTMANARDDIVSRHTLAWMLWRQGRRDQAAAEIAGLAAVEPENPYVKTLTAQIRQQGTAWGEFPLDELMSFFDDVGIGKNFDSFRVRRTAEHASTTRSRQTGQAVDETGIEWDRNGSLSAVTAFLDELKRRTPWIMLFFTSPVGGTPPRHGVQEMDASEIALVAAHRAGLMDGSDRRETLYDWVEVHPSSYSARLLLAWQGVQSGGPDKAAIRAIDDEFPEHHRWNEWLSYAFVSREQRSQIRHNAGIGERDNGSTSWTSRLLAAYPGLLKEHDDEVVSFDATALRRLFEDVAFAAAERAVPSIALR